MDDLMVYALQWANPYTEPTDGRPRVLAEVSTTTRVCPAALQALWRPGSGYVITIRHIPKPVRERAPEAKAADRQRRLRRRMEKRYPLFAEEFTAQKIAAVPTYYLDGQSDGDAERRRVLDDESAYWERMSAAVGELFVYGEVS